MYNTLSRFPVTTTDLFHDPITGYRPPNLDFQLDDWGGPKLASEPMDLAIDALLKIEEGWHPELGSFLTNPLDDMYVDLTSMYGHLPQYKDMTATEMHEDIDAQIRERLNSQGHNPNMFDKWINDNDDYYGDIDEEEKSALKQTMLDIMEEHEGNKTVHHDNFQTKNASEPMDLTIDALLKGEQHNEWFKEYYENNPIIPFFSIKDHRYLNEAQNRDDYFDRMNKLSEFHKDENKTEPSTDIQFPAGFQFSNKSKPMALAIDALLKDLSPEAKRHKLEYDKKYESSPERVKYREELNRERRRRGIYGSGDHMDVSHTEGGKLTLEPEHDNRARHFKDKGTLRPSD